jgi:hypothetical protein
VPRQEIVAPPLQEVDGEERTPFGHTIASIIGIEDKLPFKVWKRRSVRWIQSEA